MSSLQLGEHEHSPFGGSVAEANHHCNGRPALVALFERYFGKSDSSEYASEGTMAHSVVEIRLLTGRWVKGISQEMLAACAIYVDFLETWGSDFAPIPEYRFSRPSIHPKLHGTVDGVGYRRDTKTALVADLKFGAGVPVEVGGNRQCRLYSGGVVEMLESIGLPVSWIELAIVQPRYDHHEGPIRTERISRTELREFDRELKRDIERCLKPDAARKPGAWCRWCEAAPLCAEMQAKAQELLVLDFAQPPYDPQKLAEALEFAPLSSGWAKKIRSFAYGEAMRGRPAPGYKLVPKRSIKGGYVLVKESDKRPAAIVGAAQDFDEVSVDDLRAAGVMP